MWTKVIWNSFTKIFPNKVDFPGIIFNFSKLFVIVCYQPNAWLESYDRHGSFGTKISGALIVSPVLWVLSSRNILSITHSDTASYTPNVFINMTLNQDSQCNRIERLVFHCLAKCFSLTNPNVPFKNLHYYTNDFFNVPLFSVRFLQFQCSVCSVQCTVCSV